MWIDVKDWQSFFASNLGKTYLDFIKPYLKSKFLNAEKKNILGLGYTPPYLDILHHNHKDSRCIAAMPSYLGAHTWPTNGPNRVVLVEETRLPFPDNYFDIILMAHCLEFSGHQHSFLREVWRILNNEGLLIVICANKFSLWSSYGQTPLTQGGSFTPSQLLYLLQSNLFIVNNLEQNLFTLPFSWCSHNKTIATIFNKVLSKMLPSSGGVILTQAHKQTIIPPKQEKASSWLRWFQGKKRTNETCSSNLSIADQVNDYL